MISIGCQESPVAVLVIPINHSGTATFVYNEVDCIAYINSKFILKRLGVDSGLSVTIEDKGLGVPALAG